MVRKKKDKDETKVVKKRKPNAAFERLLQPSDTLALLIGEEPRPRHAITKAVWEEIKKGKNVEGVAQQGRTLTALDSYWTNFFGASTITMFQLPGRIKINTTYAV